MNPNTPESIVNLLDASKRQNIYWEEMAILNFTEALLDRIEEIGMAKQDLAAKLGVSPGYVTKLIGGQNNFTLRTMVKVARAVNSELHVGIRPSNSMGRWQSYSSETPFRLVVLPHPVTEERPDKFSPMELPLIHETIAAAA